MTKEEALRILDWIPTKGEEVDALEMAIEALEERKTGRWIRHESPNLGKCMKVLYECSVCKAWLGCEYFLRRSFCPNCGAKMEGE